MKIRYALAITTLLASAGIAEARNNNADSNANIRSDNSVQVNTHGNADPNINARVHADTNASFNRDLDPASGNRHSVRANRSMNDYEDDNRSTRSQGLNRRAYSIRDLDSNNDQQISQAEFNARANAQVSVFNNVDFNNDGVLSATELSNFNNITYGNLRSNIRPASSSSSARANSRLGLGLGILD